jgi:hypothetical protein
MAIELSVARQEVFNQDPELIRKRAEQKERFAFTRKNAVRKQVRKVKTPIVRAASLPSETKITVPSNASV